MVSILLLIISVSMNYNVQLATYVVSTQLNFFRLQPVLAVMYLVQYMPTIGYWLMDKVLFSIFYMHSVSIYDDI